MTPFSMNFSLHLLSLLPLALLTDTHPASGSQDAHHHSQGYIFSGPHPTGESACICPGIPAKPQYSTLALTGMNQSQSLWPEECQSGISDRSGAPPEVNGGGRGQGVGGAGVISQIEIVICCLVTRTGENE